MEQIAVFGAGQMGSGIAHVCALAGYEVTVIDISEPQLEKAEKSITANLDRQIKKNIITGQEANEATTRLSFQTELKDKGFFLVIEAVTESFGLKQKLLRDICTKVNLDCIIATNTSSISITQLASATSRPDKVVGLHFMNPVPVMQLVEVIRGLVTSPQTFETVQALIANLNKTIVVANDYPGFIVNRILMPMINESVYALYEGVATAEDIDIAMKLGTNQPMGPLALADLIGLDTCLSIMQVLHHGFSDSKYRPCPLLVNYVNAGWLGRKTGKGFYSYL